MSIRALFVPNLMLLNQLAIVRKSYKLIAYVNAVEVVAFLAALVVLITAQRT